MGKQSYISTLLILLFLPTYLPAMAQQVVQEDDKEIKYDITQATELTSEQALKFLSKNPENIEFLTCPEYRESLLQALFSFPELFENTVIQEYIIKKQVLSNLSDDHVLALVQVYNKMLCSKAVQERLAACKPEKLGSLLVQVNNKTLIDLFMQQADNNLFLAILETTPELKENLQVVERYNQLKFAQLKKLKQYDHKAKLVENAHKLAQVSSIQKQVAHTVPITQNPEVTQEPVLVPYADQVSSFHLTNIPQKDEPQPGVYFQTKVREQDDFFTQTGYRGRVSSNGQRHYFVHEGKRYAADGYILFYNQASQSYELKSLEDTAVREQAQAYLAQVPDEQLESLVAHNPGFKKLESYKERTKKIYIANLQPQDFVKEYSSVKHHKAASEKIAQALPQLSVSDTYNLAKNLTDEHIAAYCEQLEQKLNATAYAQLLEDKLLRLAGDKKRLQCLPTDLKQKLMSYKTRVKHHKEHAKANADFFKSYVISARPSEQKVDKLLALAEQIRADSKLQERMQTLGVDIMQVHRQAAHALHKRLDFFMASYTSKAEHSKEEEQQLKVLAAQVAEMQAYSGHLQDRFAKYGSESYEKLQHELKNLALSKPFGLDGKQLQKACARYGVDQESLNKKYEHQEQAYLQKQLAKRLLILNQQPELNNMQAQKFVKDIAQAAIKLNQENKPEQALQVLKCLDAQQVKHFFGGAATQLVNEAIDEAVNTIKNTPKKVILATLLTKVAPRFFAPAQIAMCLYGVYQNGAMLKQDISELIAAIEKGEAWHVGQAVTKVGVDAVSAAFMLKGAKKTLKAAKKKNILKETAKAMHAGIDQAQEIEKAKPIIQAIEKEAEKILIESSITTFNCDHCAIYPPKSNNTHHLRVPAYDRFRLKGKEIQQITKIWEETATPDTKGRPASLVLNWKNIKHPFELSIYCKTDKDGNRYTDLSGLHYENFIDLLKPEDGFTVKELRRLPNGVCELAISYLNSEPKKCTMFPKGSGIPQVFSWVNESLKCPTKDWQELAQEKANRFGFPFRGIVDINGIPMTVETFFNIEQPQRGLLIGTAHPLIEGQ